MATRRRHLHHPICHYREENILSLNFTSFFILLIYGASLWLTPHVYSFISLPSLFFFFLGSLSTRRTFLPLTPYCLMSPSLRYILFPCMHLRCHVLLCALFSLLHVYLFLPFVLIPTLFLPFLFLLLLFFLIFFLKRLILSPFLFITPQAGNFLLL